jgi:outer membrane protein assembly factor BamD (BamD/ComL family)
VSARSRAPEPASPTASTLDAEVAALDAVRTAISAAALHRALRLIEQYRLDFPRGELARDADVFEIETLVAQGEHREASSQAERFLARYPNDPHLARVKGLAARAHIP